MLAFLADENFRGPVARGVLRRIPTLDLIRVQDVGLLGADDPTVLQWAADHGRVLLTHDLKTIPRFAYERVSAGLPMPGVLAVSLAFPIGEMVDQVHLVAVCCDSSDFTDQVRFVPL